MLKEYQEKLIEIVNSMEGHGHGKVEISFEIIRTPHKTKIVISAGKSYVFFEKREINFDDANII